MTSIPGPKILLLGLPGAGKTFALRTLVEAGVKPCVLFTENSQATLGDLPEVAWHTINVMGRSFADQLGYAQTIAKVSADALLKALDPKRSQSAQFVSVLRTMADFTDARTGESLGAVDDWGPERALVIDSLTGLNQMMLDLISGARPTRTQQEWGIAVDTEKRFLQSLVSLNCTVVVISHLQSERDEVTGAIRLYPQGVTKNFGTDIPIMFDEVIYASADAGKFSWSTAERNIATKTRLLPLQQGLDPSFVQIFEAWKRQGGSLSQTESAQ